MHGQIRRKSMNCLRRLNRRNVYLSDQSLKFGNLLGDRSWQQMQNFCTVSPKLCRPFQKNTGTWGVVVYSVSRMLMTTT